jgi:hypothetical protein
MKKFIYGLIAGFLMGLAMIAFVTYAASIFQPNAGGTGTGTVPRAGQVLIGTSTSTYTPAYLTAGSNVTISTSSGAITISASGSGGGGGTTATINNVNGPAFTFNIAGINGISYSTSTGNITLTQATSTASQAGFLSAADWITFNGKQTAGTYITGLTGDGSASGPGSAAFTLATVNSNIGSFGSSTVVPIITVNAKGLITAVSTTTISSSSGNASGTLGLIQYSDGSGGFDASSNFYWDNINNRLFANGDVYVGGDTTSTAFGVVNANGVNGISLIAANADDLLSPTGDGMDTNLFGGNGGATSGAGGPVTVAAGSAQGGDSDGGPISLYAGQATGSGTPGFVGINSDYLGVGDGNLARFDTSKLLTTNRDYSFPDQSGVLCLTITCTEATTTILGVNGPAFIFNVLGNNGLSYSTSTGIISLTQATSSASQAGFLSSADWTTFNNKQAAITGGATTITTSDLTANRALMSTGSGKVAVSTTTAAELGFVNGVTSAIQTQLNAKEGTITAGTSAQYWRGDKSFQTLNQAAVAGLTTTDSPTFTGVSVTNATSSGTLGVPKDKTLAISGQVSVNSSSAASSASTLKFHDGTAERVLNPEKCFAPSWVIENPTATEDIPIMVFNNTSTITKVKAVNKTTGDTLTFNIGYGPSRATATSSLPKLFTSNQTVTATTTISSLTINSSSTPNNGDILRFYITAASTSQLTLDVCYRENS